MFFYQLDYKQSPKKRISNQLSPWSSTPTSLDLIYIVVQARWFFFHLQIGKFVFQRFQLSTSHGSDDLLPSPCYGFYSNLSLSFFQGFSFEILPLIAAPSGFNASSRNKLAAAWFSVLRCLEVRFCGLVKKKPFWLKANAAQKTQVQSNNQTNSQPPNQKTNQQHGCTQVTGKKVKRWHQAMWYKFAV